MKNAIILCSGGLDSVVTAHYVKKNLKFDSIVILFFNYGQRNLDSERMSATNCAGNVGGEFREIRLSELGEMSHSLINKKGKVAKMDKNDLKDTKEESKKWYVPCRNLVFLSYALAFAESLAMKDKTESDIFVGFKNEGGEGFPDTSEEFVKKMNSIAHEVCLEGVEIIAPLIEKDKEDIIFLGKELGVDFSKTFSCYVGDKKHCGVCLACKLRQAGFYWANVEDPTIYHEKMQDFRRA